MKKVYLVSVSGGKDSQATWIYMKNHYESKGKTIIPYFADTGWEADETYEHLKYLENKLGKLIRISSDKYEGFEDMCVKRKGFPSRIGRFCTQELKIIPSEKFIRSFQDKGYRVVNVTGVRAEESKSQKLKKPVFRNGVSWWFTPKRDIENLYKTTFIGTVPKPTLRKDGTWSYPKKSKAFYSKGNSVTVFQPIVHWEEEDVYDYNTDNNTKNNPLYQQGYTRVGCFPCIMAKVTEIATLPKKAVNRVNELERRVQEVATKTKPVFYHKGGKLTLFSEHYAKHHAKYGNHLSMDLGCVNHLGKCE